MELHLRSTRLWNTVESPPPEPITPDRQQRDAQCLIKIVGSCEPAQGDLLADCLTPREAWALLQATFESRTPENINRLWREFDNCSKHSSEDVTRYYSRLENAVRDLRAIDETVSTPKIVQRMFKGLGPEFEVLKSHLNMQSDLTELQCLDAMLAEEGRLGTSTTRRDSSSRGRGEGRSYSPRSRSRSPLSW